MKPISLALLFLLCCYSLVAQNLVPNPSFEEYYSCPVSEYQVYLCVGWNSYRNTPDYLNKCSVSEFSSTPKSHWGNQYPSSGDGYINLATFSHCIGSINFRDFIGAKLNNPLEIGMKYYASMKVSFADNSLVSAIATNNLGIAFSTVPYMDESDSSDFHPATITNWAMVYSTAIITDTLNWVTINGSFIADSSYKYILIGNFFDDVHTDTIHIVNDVPSQCYEAYYFIDDVCVSKDSSDCNQSVGIKFIASSKFHIAPDPANYKLNVIPQSDDEYHYILYSVLGNIVRSNRAKGTVSISVNDLTQGIYFLVIQYNNQIIRKKIIISH